MSKSHSNPSTIIFVAVVAGVCSLLLSGAATMLKPKQEANALLDKRKNILSAFGMIASKDAEAPAEVFDGKLTQLPFHPPAAQVNPLFDEGGHVATIYVNGLGQEVSLPEGMKATDLNAETEKEKANKKDMVLPIYVLYGDSMDDALAYAVPIEGKGLWSTLYGFIALETDLDTVKGITYYKQGETPGLGAEVENPAWQAKWPGKKILDENGDMVSVLVKKGGADKDDPHAVDALSGATITSNGVTDMLKNDLGLYEPYFATKRQGN